MQSKPIAIIVILLIAIGGYVLYRGSYRQPIPASTPISESTVVQEETVEPSEIPAPTTHAREITVVGSEFNFSPASINVKAGEQIKITFNNSGKSSHNLILEGLGIGTKIIGGGQTDVVEFTAPSSRTYTFFCSVPGHRSAGMEGHFIVE